MDENVNSEKSNLRAFTCERCGFEYHKANDYAPYLCYRCLRFLGKQTFKIVRQIEPAPSRTEVPNV